MPEETTASDSTTFRRNSEQSLRQRAEEVLQKRPEEMEEIPAGDIQDLIYELQVHQVELEMQNKELRQAQQALERSRDRYSDLYEFAPVGYLTLNRKGTILEANLTLATLLGVERAELIERPLSRFIASEDQDVYYHHRRRLFETQQPQSCELRMVRGDGSQLWARIEARAALDSAGQPVCRATLSDVTARKQAEEELENERAFLSAVFDNIEEAIIICDAEGRIVRFNEAARRLHGLPERPIPPDQWAEHYDLYQADGVTPLPTEEIPLFRALQGEHVQDAEIVVNPEHSASHSLVCSGQALTDATGEITGAVVTMHDITTRKRAEEALRESEEFQRAIIACSPVALYSIDREGRVLSWNDSAERIFGWTAGEVLGKPLPIVPENKQDEFAALKKRLLEGERFLNVEIVRQKKDGTLFDASLSTAPLYGSKGDLVGIVGALEDITVRKQMEAELKRSNEELEQFAYVISHDLREPARMVKSYLNLLAERYQGQLDEKADKFIDYAVDGAERMQEMINALLDLSRVGRRGQELAPTDVEAILEHTLNVLGQTIEEAEAEVTHDPLPTVMADQVQLGQVFQNLIANAIKFRREDEPPRVHVSAEREGDAWVFSVADNGIGIEPRHADRLFQIFQRLHTHEEYEGTGVGLALCKRIVERHGGRIWVESTPGNGTTFLFTLPASENT